MIGCLFAWGQAPQVCNSILAGFAGVLAVASDPEEKVATANKTAKKRGRKGASSGDAGPKIDATSGLRYLSYILVWPV